MMMILYEGDYFSATRNIGNGVILQHWKKTPASMDDSFEKDL